MIRLRRAPLIFWPALIGVLSFILGFMLVTPLGCTTSARLMANDALQRDQAAEGHTECTNLIGIDYSGSGNYNPSQWPALLAAFAAAGAGAVATRLILEQRQEQ